jgi:hypothetical protein
MIVGIPGGRWDQIAAQDLRFISVDELTSMNDHRGPAARTLITENAAVRVWLEEQSPPEPEPAPAPAPKIRLTNPI